MRCATLIMGLFHGSGGGWPGIITSPGVRPQAICCRLWLVGVVYFDRVLVLQSPTLLDIVMLQRPFAAASRSTATGVRLIRTCGRPISSPRIIRWCARGQACCLGRTGTALWSWEDATTASNRWRACMNMRSHILDGGERGHLIISQSCQYQMTENQATHTPNAVKWAKQCQTAHPN